LAPGHRREEDAMILVKYWQRPSTCVSTFFATVVMSLVAQPSFAQLKPTFELGEKKDPAVEAYKRQQEQEYNAAVRKIPEAKKKNGDPWGNIRNVNPDKK
jgi:hypothetical protein